MSGVGQEFRNHIQYGFITRQSYRAGTTIAIELAPHFVALSGTVAPKILELQGYGGCRGVRLRDSR